MEGYNFQNTEEDKREEVHQESGCEHECDCGPECECEEEYEEDMDEDDDDGELDTEEVAVEAYNRLDALVEILIKKGIITEEELEDMEERLLEEDGEEEGEAS